MKKSSNKKKFTLRDFVWYGFNYTVGIGFVGNFALLSNAMNIDGSQNSNSIGMNVVWLFIVEGLIAGLCAWGFAKMARVHHSNNNGAAYIYTRTAFGRFSGFLVAFLQYVTLPFLITLQIMVLFRGTFSADYTGDTSITAHWGNFTNLYLDLIGIVVYMGAACSIFLGIKMYKKFVNISGIIKWATAFTLVLAGLYLAFKNGSENYDYWAKGDGSNFSITGFIKAFNSCFFFFCGFETFSTAGRNIENPERNIGLGIILIMIISTIFYVVVSIIFFGAFHEFQQNMNISTWRAFQTTKWIVLSGTIIMVLSGISLKIQAAMMTGLYGGTILQPLAKEGYISDKLRKLNNDNLPVRASLLNLVITLFVILVWLIIPDIIKGFYPSSPAFNVSMFTEASSTITIFIYGMVTLITLKYGFEKKVKMKIWEWILFPFLIIFLCFAFIMHYIEVVQKIMDSNNRLSGIIEISFVIATLVFIAVWYNTYYRTKYSKRLKSNPGIQEKLNSKFEVIDDWFYVSNELHRELKYYLERNRVLHKNQDNENYAYAKKIDKELDKVINDYNKILQDRLKHDNDHIDE